MMYCHKGSASVKNLKYFSRKKHVIFVIFLLIGTYMFWFDIIFISYKIFACQLLAFMTCRRADKRIHFLLLKALHNQTKRKCRTFLKLFNLHFTPSSFTVIYAAFKSKTMQVILVCTVWSCVSEHFIRRLQLAMYLSEMKQLI